ncbi:type II toxin-antitoxin system VapC family toxin [Nitrososphaera viennensis]|uniref:PIN-domain containing protein n=2 Tax=Nitrososphaera viennensis TaxID=1034015 RepID=A0A060HCL9_9ARCH|nr:type II toxin-antitoxin system VapC family toxin [Nitrososphaera viennensis]AIC14469.1 PIN-domain containing protein [Nitrososphaera viennensis EN76]UVS69449.1 type II toxin-antitoxin system VapC family toxin [Nitrososphaera viennensis]
MIVADSSYLVEGLLKDVSLIENEGVVVSPDLALYEVVNAVWKHETVLKDIKDGRPYLDVLSKLVSARAVRFVKPDKKIIGQAYQLASKKRCTFYDAVFVVLALELGLELKTFDEAQRALLP